MNEGKSFTMGEEFADLDFNSTRLEKRFIRTMETLSKLDLPRFSGQEVKPFPDYRRERAWEKREGHTRRS